MPHEEKSLTISTPVKSSDRTLEVLEALAASDSRRTLAELAHELSIPKSSLHGILRTMVNRSWVEADETGQRFGLGVRALLIGTAYLEGDDVLTRADPILDWLADSLGEAIHLGRLDGPAVVHLANKESAHSLRYHSVAGRRLPAHATALGKAVLAEREAESVRSLLPSELTPVTAHTITTWDRLESELISTRTRGYAVDMEESTDGIRCFAVSLPRQRNQDFPIDAVGVSIPMFRVTAKVESQVIAHLLEVGERYERPQKYAHGTRGDVGQARESASGQSV